jgi:hypothetical protein
VDDYDRLVEARARLRAYGEDPDRDAEAFEATGDGGWANYGVDDERLLGSGWSGAELYEHDPTLVLALADADKRTPGPGGRHHPVRPPANRPVQQVGPYWNGSADLAAHDKDPASCRP